jgi:hypothetical protein
MLYRSNALPGTVLLVLLQVATADPVPAEFESTEFPDGTDVLLDGFESGDTCAWSSTIGLEGVCVVQVVAIQNQLVTGHVRLESVVITALTADRKGLWVADEVSAAPYNGIFVYRGGGAAPLPAEFQIGVPVDIEGDIEEFDIAPPGDTLTEIVASIEAVVAGPVGDAPVPYTGEGVATLAAMAAGEPYESVLVRIQNVAVMAVNTGDRVTLRDSASSTIVMDDVAYDYAAGTYPIGTCFESVTGVMTVNVFDDERRILPRAEVDLVIGAGCAP